MGENSQSKLRRLVTHSSVWTFGRTAECQEEVIRPPLSILRLQGMNLVDMVYALLGLTSGSTQYPADRIKVKIDYSLEKDGIYILRLR